MIVNVLVRDESGAGLVVVRQAVHMTLGHARQFPGTADRGESVHDALAP